MRFGCRNLFDLSDLHDIDVDHVDDILDVAAEVLQDYGPDHGNTRIERLARWVVYNVGEVPSMHRCAEMARVHQATVFGTLDEEGVYITAHARRMPAPDARYFATQILRAAARTEE